MLQKLASALLLLSAWLCLGTGRVHATTFLQFQSTYLGNGWFQYQMSVMNDPFFTEADIVDLLVSFPGEIDQSTSTNWKNTDISSTYSTWAFTHGIPARPYQETFLIQSLDTSYKLDTNGAIAVLSPNPAAVNPLWSGVATKNILGCAKMPALVPCTPAEADSSPTNLVFVLKLLPDVHISQLIQTNGNIYGVDFTWNDQSTFLLQGSTDLNNWTNVAYVWSSPPETMWTTNEPLNSFGTLFRLSLVAATHSTNLPPLNSSLAPKLIISSPSLTPPVVAPKNPGPPILRVTNIQFADGNVLVNLATPPGQTVNVLALDAHGATQQMQQAIAKGATTTVTFDASTLPNPVYFQATAVQ